MSNSISIISEHLRGYIYELRSRGAVDFGERVRMDCETAVKEICDTISSSEKKIKELEERIKDMVKDDE
jgi:hypothetical protein